MRIRFWLSALALCAVVPIGTAQAAVTEDSFLLRNTNDLIDLCSATQSDPLYTAASNFCQGFTVGVYRVLHEQDEARKYRHMFCAPNPVPSRNEAIAGFLQWAKADPSHAAHSPADEIAEYLAEQYKCPRGR